MLNCDFLVIGSGQTGIKIANELANIGYKVILSEQSEIGGSYFNSFELPKKLLWQKSEHFFGALSLLRKKPVTFAELVEIRNSFNQEIKKEIEKTKDQKLTSFKKNKLAFLHGKVSFNSKNQAEINNETDRHIVNFEKCVIAVGKNSLVKPDIKGIDQIPLLYQHTAFVLPKLPSHLAIIGVTKNSLEIAEIYIKLGIPVTIIEQKAEDKCLLEFDKIAVSWAFKNLLTKKVVIHFKTKIKSLEMHKDNLIINTSKEKLEASHIYTDLLEGFDEDDLGLDKIGIKYSPAGIVVDSQNRTKIKNIWAFGQCVDSANELGNKNIVNKFLNDQKSLKESNKKAPKILDLFSKNFSFVADFTIESIKLQSSIATLGLTEETAISTLGPSVKTKTFVSSDNKGIIKLVYRPKMDELYGVTLMGDYHDKFYELAVYFLQNKISATKVISFFSIQD